MSEFLARLVEVEDERTKSKDEAERITPPETQAVTVRELSSLFAYYQGRPDAPPPPAPSKTVLRSSQPKPSPSDPADSPAGAEIKAKAQGEKTPPPVLEGSKAASNPSVSSVELNTKGTAEESSASSHSSSPNPSPLITVKPPVLLDENILMSSSEDAPSPAGPILIPIASGKGGVGKTSFAVNLSIALGNSFEAWEKRITLMDGDIGLPNADLVLGVRPARNLEHFLRRDAGRLEEIAERTPYRNLWFIGGSGGSTLGMANLYYQQRQRFIENILRVPTDYLILDLGASNSHLVVDFFSLVNSGIVIFTPEPTAVRDAYQLIKSVVIRRLHREFKENKPAKRMIRRFEDPNDREILTMDDLLRALERDFGTEGKEASGQIRAVLAPLRPRLVVNRAFSISEGIEVAKRMEATIRRHLGIDVGYLGPIIDDESVSRAVRARSPFIVSAPRSKASQAVEAIKRRLIENQDFTMEANVSVWKSYLKGLWRLREAV